MSVGDIEYSQGNTFLPISQGHKGDSLLYEDLTKLIRHFKDYGDYALLLAVLSYNVGPYKVTGGGKYKPSKLIRKIQQGYKDIEEEYLDFSRWKGKVVPSIRRRRWVESTTSSLTSRNDRLLRMRIDSWQSVIFVFSALRSNLERKACLASHQNRLFCSRQYTLRQRHSSCIAKVPLLHR